ncbi:MAG: cryptochrome/photolyase family protein [Acidimicrobiales bacterium]
MRSIWVFGDQLNRRIGALADADPDDTRIVLVESEELLDRGRHVQRVHLVVTAMRRFAIELEDAGFEVDLRLAPTIADGIRAHIDELDPSEVVATEPNSRRAQALCERLDVTQVRSNQFLCHKDDFAAWAADQSSMQMERFYRWRRRELGYLMDDDEPVGGTWNHDADNRQPPPDDPSIFTDPQTSELDELDAEVLDSLPAGHGAQPVGIWATSRRSALARLRHFVDHELVRFGPYEDAMTHRSWSLAHSALSPYLNLGLLLPGEVCDRVEERFRNGDVPINSAEGFIRQVIGWREYVWGLYWLWPDHADSNHLGHRRELPPMFTGEADTEMRCVADVLDGLHERAWVHHIPRLMVLSNLSNLYGIHPRRVMDWMSDNYVDGAEWVMVPNVMGMGLWADGGRMATKPYISGGAYINRMSDYCSDCRYDHKARTGDDACPFTTLYWDFLARHEEKLSDNHRLARPLANMRRLSDLDEVRDRASTVVRSIRDGRI